jgi:hypothetical protein
MDVQDKAVYTLAAQQRGAEGNDGRVRGPQDFAHSGRLLTVPVKVESEH